MLGNSPFRCRQDLVDIYPGNDLIRQNLPVNSNSVKLPKFCESDPELWFVQIESIFDRLKIVTEETRSQIVLSQVDADILSCVRHIVIINPRPPNCYTQLKKELISHFAISGEARVFQVIHGDVTNNGKPSQMLNRLRSLNAGNCSDDVLKTIFLAKLPHPHQLSLSACSGITLNELASRADKMAEVDRIAAASNAAVTIEAPKSSGEDKIEVLATEVANLKSKFEETSGRRSRDPQRSEGGNHYRGRGRSRPFGRGNNNYRGRGRARGNYRSNSYGRGYNPRNNQFQYNPFHNRFRSSSPYHRNSHHNYSQHCSPEPCCPRQQNSCHNQSQSGN